MSSRTKKISIAVVVLIVIFFLYSYLSHRSDSTTDAALTTIDGTDSNIGHEFIALLAKIKAIKLDEGFFTSPTFVSLKDSRVTIAPQPAGRSNPFAPIGAPDSF